MAGYGKTQTKLQQNSVSSAVVSSQIGSLKGDTTIAVGGKLTTEAAQLYAGGDLKLQGREVSLGEAYNRSEQHSRTQRKQTGFIITLILRENSVVIMLVIWREIDLAGLQSWIIWYPSLAELI
nr:hypothetical protein [uncultured Neisseria sp.]